MALVLRDGDYSVKNACRLEQASANEILLQRVLLKLSAKRGRFPFLEDLGSQLWKLGALPKTARQSAAAQYVAEALADEPGITVGQVTLTYQENGRMLLQAELQGEESLTVTMDIR